MFTEIKTILYQETGYYVSDLVFHAFGEEARPRGQQRTDVHRPVERRR